MERNTKVILIFFTAIIILVVIMYFSTIGVNNQTNKNEFIAVGGGFFPAIGSGEIGIIEFSDFACPVCKLNEPIIKEVIRNYKGEISFYYRNFPLPIHKNSFEASLASMCANEQGKFWEYHSILFENQGNFENEKLKEYASQLSLNINSFNDCLDNKKYENEVDQDFNEGKAAGVRGTPTFFINGKRIEGFQSFDSLKNIIGKAKNV